VTLHRTKELASTGIKPGKSQLKRTPLNRVSKKLREKMAAIHDQREEFRSSVGACERCGARGVPLDPHELAKRSKTADWFCRSNTIFVCRPCHELLEDYSKVPLVQQILLLARRRWDDYDIGVVNALRGRAPTAITDRDVLRAALDLLERLSGPRSDVVAKLCD
jgi:hypothetical protein